MQLTSTAFQQGKRIPAKYTCDAEGINPPLQIEDVPAHTKTLALIMDDPDVPESVRKDRMFVHWVVFNIPPSVHTIAENSVPPGILGNHTRGGLGYFGPCPPDREHRYFFKLYALDISLDLPEGATKTDVEKAMAGHILAQAELMGRYERVDK
jgi:Raf kinase inhibitor-like YbhB/YbcL family protein